MGRKELLHHFPIHRIVDVVEQIDVAHPDREIADLLGVGSGSCLQVGLPSQSVDVGGAHQSTHEVIGDAGRALGLGVEIDPEPLGLDQPAATAVDAHPHLAPPTGCPRTPPPQAKHVLEFDRADQVDHGAPDDPQRMGVVVAHLAELVLPHVLDVAQGPVETQPAESVDIADAQWPLPFEHVGIGIGYGHQHLGQAGGGGREVAHCCDHAKTPSG